MAKIHPAAIVSKDAHLDDVEVGPYAIIEDGVVIGKGTRIMAHAYICSGTTIGSDCEAHMGAVLGHTPQHLQFKGENSVLKIGDRNIFREYSSVHRGSKEGLNTIIGDDNFFMGFSHIAHDCRIGNNVVLCNGVLLAGHVMVEDRAFISGNAAVHQFSRIGKLAMIGGLTVVNKDVAPYVLVEGDSEVCSLNVVGLKRSDISEEAKSQIKQIYKLIYRSSLNLSHALEEAGKISDLTIEARHMMDFIKSSKRGICKGRRAPDFDSETEAI
ncbi:MAG: acyl-ACP--UDP-N-acetylglucosamine O-acyltransferase [Candidatus Omnitrophota bacterium]